MIPNKYSPETSQTSITNLKVWSTITQSEPEILWKLSEILYYSIDWWMKCVFLFIDLILVNRVRCRVFLETIGFSSVVYISMYSYEIFWQGFEKCKLTYILRGKFVLVFSHKRFSVQTRKYFIKVLLSSLIPLLKNLGCRHLCLHSSETLLLH